MFNLSLNDLCIGPTESNIILKMVIAFLLGGILGFQREVTHHPAGLRTHILVCIGSAGFMLLAFYISHNYRGEFPFDPGRVMQGVITGMGFIGAGAIMKEGMSIHGITTSASLWVACAVGMMVGANALVLAIVSTLIALITLIFPESTLKKM